MFDEDTDEEPSLEELFETDDTDPLDDLNDDTDDAVSSTDEDSDDADWTASLLEDDAQESADSEFSFDNVPEDEPADAEPASEPPATTTATDSSVDPPATTDANAGSSFPAIPFSLPNSSETDREWLSTTVDYTKFALKKIFYLVMAPAIYITGFTAGVAIYLLFKAIAFGIFVAFVQLWLDNPLAMTRTEQYGATAVLIVLFVLALFGNFAVNDHFDLNTDA